MKKLFRRGGFAACVAKRQQGYSTMKRYLVLVLAALAFAMVAPSAFATRVIFDPPTLPSTTPPGCTHSAPCSLGLVNHTYQVAFLPCGDVLGLDTSGFTYCLWMNNVTRHPVSTFTFEFIVPSGGSGSGGLTCDTQGLPVGTVTSIDCPSTMPAAGELFPVSFHISPSLPNRTDFYLFTDFNYSPGVANVSVSVPEPGVLGMFGFGLLALGVGFGWQKRRQTSRSNEAV